MCAFQPRHPRGKSKPESSARFSAQGSVAAMMKDLNADD